MDTALHLHSTANQPFFDVSSLNVIGSHVNDFLYSSKYTKRTLEKYDKFLNTAICKTNFDELILNKIPEPKSGEKVAEVWDAIKKGKEDPVSFLEDTTLMVKRFKKISELVGTERIKYASPECGLKAFPSYNCALTYLHRVSEAVKAFRHHSKLNSFKYP